MTLPDADPADPIDAFIARWKASGGDEKANAQPFVAELCDLLGVPRPDPARESDAANDYVFERRVTKTHGDGSKTKLFIDCYRRDAFVLESKQSAHGGRGSKPDPSQTELLSEARPPEDTASRRTGTARRGTPGWQKAMTGAYHQAADYAMRLPTDHRPPPFLLVVDVGHVLEVYANFQRQGLNYTQFPDRRGFRIAMDDLRDEAVRGRLGTIWLDPMSLDPSARAAEVTRDIAARLAKVASALEGRHDPQEVASFLMRCLFTMFAEDVGLLPENGFRDLLRGLKDRPRDFAPALETLWRDMDEGAFSGTLQTSLRRFNGSLFKERRALPLDRAQIHELSVAADKDWSDVEPAIFGTLLERALDPRERAKLGAHYTPRAYVERLVVPTVIEPLRDDWLEAQTAAAKLAEDGDEAGARRLIAAFHHRLCTTRVLDPACGTGNFLYVALELMKQLEGEVLDALGNYGEAQDRLALRGETVDPSQFFGLEINPRAVRIADLVLWIGYIKWQIRNGGLQAVTEPVLHAYGTIREQDAVLAYDAKALALDEGGRPLSTWDGHTMRPHPVTGLPVPDETARVEAYTYANPRRAAWPEAEFVVGNPPFIGGKRHARGARRRLCRGVRGRPGPEARRVAPTS